MTPEEEIRRAERVQAFLDDELQPILDDMRVLAIEGITHADVTDQNALTAMVTKLQVLDEFEIQLKSVLTSGKLATAQLANK